jgi:hypothetical protein
LPPGAQKLGAVSVACDGRATDKGELAKHQLAAPLSAK